jgi:prefoldin subunit 5
MFSIISTKRLKMIEERLQTIVIQLEALNRNYDRLNDTIHEELRGAKKELEDIM